MNISNSLVLRLAEEGRDDRLNVKGKNVGIKSMELDLRPITMFNYKIVTGKAN